MQFIKSYSSDINQVNRLIVSSFCEINEFRVVNNLLIRNLIIDESNPEEFSKLNQFIAIYKKNEERFDFEQLIELFEFVISPSDKAINGAVYTPKLIREFILKSSLTENIDLNSTACDIACGCGGFLYSFALELNNKGKKFQDIFKDNLFGIDVTEYSIERTKILLCLLAISKLEDKKVFKFNFFIDNSLSFDWFENCGVIKKDRGFDFIFSNPPYVSSANIDDNTKTLLKDWEVTKTGKADLYIPFFEIGMKWLKEKGTLGYITVNSFYKSLNGRALRNYLSKNKFCFKLIDFGSEQIFRNRNTYTCICIIKKENGKIQYTKSKSKELSSLNHNDFVSIEYDKLNNKEGWLLDNYEIQLNIRRIENIGLKLGEVFSIKNGFATLRNKIYLFKPIGEDEHFYFLQKGANTYLIEKSICRNAIKPNVLKNEEEISDLTEKLIFPYYVDNQPSLFEPSKATIVNISVEDMATKYPHTLDYLKKFKKELSLRDKGKIQYPVWYAYGRTQALNIRDKKLLFPYMSDKPYFVYTDDEDLMFYNGYAIVSKSEKDLKFIKKILTSKVFWYYVTNISKPYSGNYFALAKNYIKNFGVPEFTPKEKIEFMSLKSQKSIDLYLIKKYNICF